jgi:hypothetical protein
LAVASFSFTTEIIDSKISLLIKIIKWATNIIIKAFIKTTAIDSFNLRAFITKITIKAAKITTAIKIIVKATKITTKVVKIIIKIAIKVIKTIVEDIRIIVNLKAFIIKIIIIVMEFIKIIDLFIMETIIMCLNLDINTFSYQL